MKVFISYSSKDRKWVKEWLLPRLEKAGVETYIDYRDFKVGVPSVVNIEEGLSNCDKTLLILTPNWVASEWTAFEGILLQTDDLIGKRETIMPLMLEKCELPKRENPLKPGDLDCHPLVREHMRIAEKMIEEMGYLRRRSEVDEIKKQLKMKNEK